MATMIRTWDGKEISLVDAQAKYVGSAYTVAIEDGVALDREMGTCDNLGKRTLTPHRSGCDAYLVQRKSGKVVKVIDCSIIS